MPGRTVPLITGQIYHVLNRGIADQPTFFGNKGYRRAIEAILFYRHSNPPLRYSYFVRLPKDRRAEILSGLSAQKDYLVDIFAYCLMPNHFHLLLYQLKDGGISAFTSRFVNSYTKYVNTKLDRHGPIFQGKFKAIRISTDEQLLHVQRYIHLNPYSGLIVKNFRELENYPYSSLKEYLNSELGKTCNRTVLLSYFKNDIYSFKKFIFDNADYQKKLQRVKHLLLEK